MSIPSFSLEGNVAIVTGSRRGIGKAIALTFAEAGADVAVCDLVVKDGALRAVADEIQRLGRRSLAVQVDVTRKSEVDNFVKRVVDELGAIDILVNNAGILFTEPLLEIPEDKWDRIMNVNLKGYYLCSQAAGRRMVEQKKGTIINIASSAAFKGMPAIGAYCITKAGVVMLTRALAQELSSHNIRVNAIAPATVNTEIIRDIVATPEGLAAQVARIPLGRLGEVSDVAGAALFLASEASSFITGHTLLVDGGFTA